VGHELGCGPEALVHSLASAQNADGIVVVSAGLAATRGLNAVSELLARHPGLPVCSLGLELPGIPSVVADNRPGLEDVIDHVIVTHGRRRLVCLAGLLANPDAAVRFDVYKVALARHRIVFDSDLVMYGMTEINSARLAVQQLLQQGIEFDGIVAFNDMVALGALEMLEKAGVQVPEQVALTGFDDLPIGRSTQPALTTVRQPTRAMAGAAIDLVVAQLVGQDVPLLTSLAVEAVRRASCGCQAKLTPLFAQRPHEVREDLPEWLAANEQRLVGQITAKLGKNVAAEDAWPLALLGTLKLEFSGHRGAFVAALQARMNRAADREYEYENLQRAVAVLREAFATVARQLDTLWSEAERSLAIATMADQARQHVAAEVAYHGLHTSGMSLTRAFDWSSLKQRMAETLPTLAESAFISLKAGEGIEVLQPFFCMQDGAVCTSELERFDARQLIPPDATWTPRQRSRLVLPLTDEDEYLGIAVVELRPGLGIHEMLRSQISTALRSVSLHQQIVQKTAQHERSVQERLATTNRLESLGVLAGGVAHDLNNALGPLVALPNIILDQLREVALGSKESSIVADLELLQGASLRAAQTIKDLLTLGRQGRTLKEPLDVNRFANNAIESDQVLREFAVRRGVSLSCVLSSEQLTIDASQSQLQRALSNLLRNAVDATEPGKSIELKTYAVDLTEPLEAYETVEPGHYAVIEVRDTGCGIAPADLGRIFEPFFSRKRLSESSGSGLGLAIVHGVVKEHQGFVSVESAPGRGATFTLYFPRVASRPRSARIDPPIQVGTGRILVVDDDPVQLRTAKRVLSHHGYDVTTAANSSEAYQFHEAALEAGRTKGFDLVIVDMILNEAEDGLELFARLQRLNDANRGIVVSGNAPTERLDQAMVKGLRFLAKPYRAEELVESVQLALSEPVPQSITNAPGPATG
jgi:signal transduction histidine kinase/DNA-binding LacI/PurR family transcriptional regulator/ActR/RegA family two-component response regulator